MKLLLTLLLGIALLGPHGGILKAEEDEDSASVEIIRQGAEQGDAFAQYELGVCYHKGNGVAKDAIEAVKWWRKAAEKGLAPAQSKLAGCFALGEVVPKDYVAAYMWANLGAATEKSARKIREYVEKKMTAEQIAEAQRLSRDWKPRF